MGASVYIIVCRRQRAGHNHAQKHGVEPDALYQHAGRKAPQRQARVEGHEERGVGRTATVRRHGVHGHGLQRRLNGPEAEAQQHGRQQIARHVVGAHQQHYAAHNGGIARIDQPRLATAVDGAPQRKARGHRGHGYEHKVDAAARQPARGGIDGHIDLDHAIGHHEEELRDGRRRRHGLEQPANAQRRRRKRIAARPDARTHRQRRHRHGRRERKQRLKAAGVHQRQAYGRSQRRGYGHRQPEHAQTLAHAARRHNVGHPRRGRIACRRMEHAVSRAQHHGQSYARRHAIARRSHGHARKARHQNGAPAASVDHPPHKRARHYRRKAEERRGHAYGHGIAAQVPHKERERGQQGMKVDEHKQIDKADAHKRAGPQAGRLAGS